MKLFLGRCARCGRHKEVLEDNLIGNKILRICKKCLSEQSTFFATHSREAETGETNKRHKDYTSSITSKRHDN